MSVVAYICGYVYLLLWSFAYEFIKYFSVFGSMFLNFIMLVFSFVLKCEVDLISTFRALLRWSLPEEVMHSKLLRDITMCSWMGSL